MKNLTVRQGLAGQASSPQEYETPAIWPWILFLLLLIGGGVFVYWWVWMRHGSDDDKAEAEMERVEDENKFQDMKEPTKPQTPGVIVSESKIKRGQVVESEKTEGGDLETDQKSEADQEIESQEIESKETSGFNDEEESRSAVPVESQDIEPEETQDNVPKETQPVVPTADQNAELQKADSDTNEFQTQEKTQEENLNKDLEVSKQSLDEKNKAAKPADLQESKTSTQKKSKPSDSKKASPLGESEKEKSEKSEKSEQNKQESTEHLIDFEPVPIPPADTASDGKPEDNDHKKPEQTEDENMIEFEAPVFDSDEESKKSNEQKSEEEPEKQTVPEKNNKKKADKQDDKKETDINGAESDLEEAKPIKSTHALETLLDLAQTYISMEDYEAAKQSLEEVLEHGNKQQQKEARDLLDKLANS